MTAPTSSAQSAQLASSSTRPYSLKDYVLLKLNCLDRGQPFLTVAWKSTSDFGVIPVFRRQGRILPYSPLPRLPGRSAWEWSYEWEHFLGSPFVDSNGKGPIIPVTSLNQKKLASTMTHGLWYSILSPAKLLWSWVSLNMFACLVTILMPVALF